jgi:Ca-activated chloride channel family protein
MKSVWSSALALPGIALLLASTLLTASSAAKSNTPYPAGRLEALGKDGKPLGSCPLKHTEVTADIAGFIVRVTVRQEFHNTFRHKIEAVYTFPLSQDAAVDRMRMTVGKRVIEGQIKERGEARQIYEQAKAAGHVASLLDQERPNIFTQSVANIEPGEAVEITISYSETLDWKEGMFHFIFPMVVGPRYIPGQQAGPDGLGFAPPTTEVPDADRITPKPTRPETRAGHDISITVDLDAGLPIRHLESKQHQIDVKYTATDKRRATVRLANAVTIPNKDFVLEYQTASDRIEDTVLAHTDQRGKFFTLVLQPPKRVRSRLVVPKELVFVIDKSGSMSGFPIETAKKAMAMCIDGLNENDTFNLMTFEGGVGFCFPFPVPNTAANRRTAQRYLADLRGSGGTEMMKAIHACLAGQDDPERLRVVCFMTDGYVGNDMAIIDAVRKNAGTARVFSFGIGTAVNRFLLDGMAHAGRGEVQYILSSEQAAGAGERFYERVRMPVLTDIRLQFAGLDVEEVYPKQIPDLFSAKPVVVKGRYRKGGHGTIILSGKTGEGPFERKIDVRLPDEQPQNEVLAPLWARAKVDHLMSQDLTGIQRSQPKPAIKEEILGLGLRYQLLTQFTSFVAVEYQRVTKDGKAETVAVPVEIPEGVSYEGVFGAAEASEMMPGMMPGRARAAYKSQSAGGFRAAKGKGGSAGGGMGGMGGGMGGFGGSLSDAKSDRSRRSPGASGARGGRGPGSGAVARQEKPVGQNAGPKLALELQGLAEKVASHASNGTLTIGKIRVEAFRVNIIVHLSDVSDQVIAKLKTLGFKETRRTQTGLVIGSIHVEKLDALAALAEVQRIEPAPRNESR